MIVKLGQGGARLGDSLLEGEAAPLTAGIFELLQLHQRGLGPNPFAAAALHNVAQRARHGREKLREASLRAGPKLFEVSSAAAKEST